MQVNRISCRSWRNLADGSICPHGGVNLFYGDNAQGKTNLLEAIWMCTGERSFRGAKDSDLIAFSKPAAEISLDFSTREREQNIRIAFSPDGKTAELNHVKKTGVSALSGHFLAVVFSPVHLSLIKGGPDGRRRFADSALCQLKVSYRVLLSEYRRAVAQRNALLRDTKSPVFDEMLSVWEARIARIGSRIAYQREKYIERILPAAEEFYHGLSGQKETFSAACTDACGVTPEERERRLLEELFLSRAEDKKTLSTSVGPHRQDITVLIDGRSARDFGSQGQQRSAALALKLAEAEALIDFYGEQPVALLDDVMSELDAKHQDYILNRLHGWQVFITCCDPAPLRALSDGKAFFVENGRISECEQPPD